MKIAIAGQSGHIHYVLDALSKDSELSVCAISPGAPDEDISQLHNDLTKLDQSPVIYNSYEDMLEKACADIAVASAPFYMNDKITALALQHGLPVFSEKPLALTLDALSELHRVQEKSGSPICAMMGLRCDAHFAAANKAVKDGRIGNIVMMTGQKSYRLGQRPVFYSQRETYGGTIPWIGIHAIDWCHWMSGKRFVSVNAHQQRLGNGGNGTMESAAAMLFMLEDGVPVGINIDFLRPAMAPTHEDDRVRVAGTLGVLEVSHHNVLLLKHDEPPKMLERLETPGIFSNFVKSLRGEGEPPISTEESFYITAVSLIAQIAADRKQTVELKEFGW